MLEALIRSHLEHITTCQKHLCRYVACVGCQWFVFKTYGSHLLIEGFAFSLSSCSFCLLINFDWHMQLLKLKEALDFALAALKLDPTNSEAAERVVNIREDIAAGLFLLCVL